MSISQLSKMCLSSCEGLRFGLHDSPPREKNLIVTFKQVGQQTVTHRYSPDGRTRCWSLSCSLSQIHCKPSSSIAAHCYLVRSVAICYPSLKSDSIRSIWAGKRGGAELSIKGDDAIILKSANNRPHLQAYAELWLHDRWACRCRVWALWSKVASDNEQAPVI